MTTRPRPLIGALIALATILILVTAGAVATLVGCGPEPAGIDPQAPIDPARQYHLVVWDYRLPFTSLGGAPYSEGSREVIDDFERRHPNVTVDLHLVDPADGPAKLAEALAAGYPPDVYCSPYGPPAVGSELQIPLGLYLDYETWSRFDPVAWQAVKVDDTIWALPRWLMLWPWLGNRDLLGQAGVDVERVSRDGWTRDEFAAAAARLAASAGRGSGLAFLDSIAPAATFRDLLLAGHLAGPEAPTAPTAPAGPADPGVPAAPPAPTAPASLAAPAAPVAQDYWLGPEPSLVAGWLEELRNAGGLGSGSGAVDAFLHGKVAVLASPSPWAVTFLMELVERPAPSQFSLPRREAPPPMVLLPPPSGPGQSSAAWISAATVAVFRQARYRGDDNTRLAAELALELTEGLRPWLRNEVLCVPATASEQASWRLRGEKFGEVGALALKSFERLQAWPKDRLSQVLTALNYGGRPILVGREAESGPGAGSAGSDGEAASSARGYLGPFLQEAVVPVATRFWRGEATAAEMVTEITDALWRGP